jgi:hypothetical protein
MPNIREFSAPNDLGLHPDDRASESLAGSGRRIAALYSEAADAKMSEGRTAASTIGDVGSVAVKYMDHQQISTGAAKGAELFDSLTNSKDQAIKAIDPNDPAYGQKVEAAVKQWRENNLEPALEKFSDGFSTENSQAWAEHFIDSTRNHMFTSTSADIATAAKIGVTNAVRTTANVASNTALNDPSSVPAQLDLLKHSINGMVDSSSLTGTASAAVKTEVLEKASEQTVKAGAIGAIQKSNDPEKTAAEWVAKYPQYINGAEAVQLAANARQQIRSRNYDYETNRRREKEETQDRSTEVANQYIIDVRSKDPKLKGDPTAVKILNDTNLTKADKNALLNNLDRQNGGPAATDPAVALDLDKRMFDPNNPTSAMDVLKADTAHQLSSHDVESRLKLIAERDKGDFKDPTVKYALDAVGAMFGTSQKGQEKNALFNQEIMPKLIQMRNAGQLRPGDFDTKNPESFLMKTYKQFELTEQEKTQAFFEKMARGAPIDLTNMPSISGTKPAAQASVPTRKVGDVAVPPALNGIAALQLSKDRTRWRDSTTGTIYDLKGNEIKQ